MHNVIVSPNIFPLDSDLSGRKHYQTFGQPGGQENKQAFDHKKNAWDAFAMHTRGENNNTF